MVTSLEVTPSVSQSVSSSSNLLYEGLYGTSSGLGIFTERAEGFLNSVSGTRKMRIQKMRIQEYITLDLFFVLVFLMVLYLFLAREILFPPISVFSISQLPSAQAP